MESDRSFFAERLSALRAEIGRVLVGQDAVVTHLLTCLVCDGHVLLEGVPGLGKTLLVRTLAQSLGMHWRRVQCTPDLMPADILGTHVLEEAPDTGRRRTVFQEGPIFTQLLLADEINRATPKTQSALLEAMQERQVTLRGETRPLPEPFLVLATQNPLEQEGTYPLPEAQLDRFFYKIVVPMPGLDELEQIMVRTTGSHTQQASPVLTPADLPRLRALVREVPIAPEVARYALRVVLGTHGNHAGGTPTAKQYLRFGASPRGAQTMVLAAKARALGEGRARVAIEDVRAVAVPALRHRVGLAFEAESEGIRADEIVQRVLREVPEADTAVMRELNRA